MAKVEIKEHEEPEIQYLASPELFEKIHAWLEKRGSIRKKTKDTGPADIATYYDTKHYRLLREGIEYRVKQSKWSGLRHDMKIPRDANDREVLPDSNDILWRRELKFNTEQEKPSLSVFWGLAVLKPVVDRLKIRFFEKELIAQFKSIFFKEKIDHDTDCGRGRVEYSFQRGHLETMEGDKRTAELHILEIELRDGFMEALLEEKKALEAEFMPQGLKLLSERKVIMGIGLHEGNMSEKQEAGFRDAKIRNTRAYAAAIREAGYGCKLAA